MPEQAPNMAVVKGGDNPSGIGLCHFILVFLPTGVGGQYPTGAVRS